MTNSSEKAPRVVVLGAGYAGVTAAEVIASKSDAAVTLINDHDRFHERMRNHQLATGQRLRDIPLSDLVKRTGIRLVIDRVIHVDLEARQVLLAGDTVPVVYDTLVYALGSRADLDAVPGVAEHATAVATADQAQRVHERAGRAGTIAVVGGGLTGIETVTELAETYPDRPVFLVAGGMPGAMLNEGGRRHLHRTFDCLGIQVLTDAVVAKVARDGLLLENGDHLDADAVVWAAGFKVPPLAREAGLAVDDRGRMLVDPTLRSVSHPDVYGVGDAAAARNEDGHEVRHRTGHFVVTMNRTGPPRRGLPLRSFAVALISTLSNPNGTARRRRDAFPEASVVSTANLPVVPRNRLASSISTTVVSAIGADSG